MYPSKKFHLLDIRPTLSMLLTWLWHLDLHSDPYQSKYGEICLLVKARNNTAYNSEISCQPQQQALRSDEMEAHTVDAHSLKEIQTQVA